MSYGTKEVTFNIIEHVAVLDTRSGGWTKELNLVQWGDNSPKYDIRDWDPEHEKCGKGATFTEKELLALKGALDNFFKDTPGVPEDKTPIAITPSGLKVGK